MKEGYTPWGTQLSGLSGYRKPTWNEDEFEREGDTGIVFYNIIEERMMTYLSSFAIYKISPSPLLLVNASKPRIIHQFSGTYVYLESRPCFIMRAILSAHDFKLTRYPFLLIDIKNNSFGFIDWNFTSYHYGVKEAENDSVFIFPKNPKELIRYTTDLSGKTVRLDAISWQPLSQFDKAEYHFWAGL